MQGQPPPSLKQNPKEQQFFLARPSLILLTWLLLAMIDTQSNSIQSWNFGKNGFNIGQPKVNSNTYRTKKWGDSIQKTIPLFRFNNIDTGWIRNVPKNIFLKLLTTVKALLSWKKNCVLLLMEDDFLTVHRQTPMSIHILKTYDIIC